MEEAPPLAAGVRVVARILPPDAAATATTGGLFQVGAVRTASSAVVSFAVAAASSSGGASTTRKDRDEYKVDWCYLKDDSNHHIFASEVKPLILNLIRGSNPCVVACGATANAHLFMGSEDRPSLVTMAMEQILHFSKPIGGAVRVSSYQVLQDNHIFDLLDPKDQEVLILEDADGRTHLKGLSRVHVKSIEEFAQLSCFASDENQQAMQTSQNQPPTKSNQNKQPTNFNQNQQSTKRNQNQQSIKANQSHQSMEPRKLNTRGHQGLVIYISRFDQEGKECVVAKMNFLSLAGYVDPKKINGGGLALTNNCNKSMHALMNVVKALNSNQSFVPYRQSKVTRILQDSLCKTSGAVLIACLDEVSCQDAISTLTLASRSSLVSNEQCHRSSMSARSTIKSSVNLSTNTKYSSRAFLPSIHQPVSLVEKQDRPQFNKSALKTCRTPIANKRSQPIMHNAKRIGNSLGTSIKTKQKDAKPTMSGRTLFRPITNSSKMNSVKRKSSKDDVIAVASTVVKQSEEVRSLQGMEIQAPSTDEEDGIVVSSTVVKQSEEVQSLHGMEIQAEVSDERGTVVDDVSCEMRETIPISIKEEDYSSSGLDVELSCTDMGETYSSNVHDNLVEKTPISNTEPSPKLSDRLREISNSLKLLSARPVSRMAKNLGVECVREINTEAPEPESTIAQKLDMENVQEINIDEAEPKTPMAQLKFEQAVNPKDIFEARSTGIKKSLVQECLTFLNSANKEQLKTLKGIGEKRANYILELREESPELFKEIDDLKDIIGMTTKEIKKMVSGIIDS